MFSSIGTFLDSQKMQSYLDSWNENRLMHNKYFENKNKDSEQDEIEIDDNLTKRD